jgi:hypothetical protein
MKYFAIFTIFLFFSFSTPQKQTDAKSILGFDVTRKVKAILIYEEEIITNEIGKTDTLKRIVEELKFNDQGMLCFSADFKEFFDSFFYTGNQLMEERQYHYKDLEQITIYAYDILGNVKEIRFKNGRKEYFQCFNYDFDNHFISSKHQNRNGKLLSLDTTIYNRDGKELSRNSYSVVRSKQRIFKSRLSIYNQDGQIIERREHQYYKGKPIGLILHTYSYYQGKRQVESVDVNGNHRTIRYDYLYNENGDCIEIIQKSYYTVNQIDYYNVTKWKIEYNE